MGKSLSKSVKSGVSRKVSVMTFQIAKEDTASATLRSDNGQTDRMYEFESSVVVKPDPGGTKWVVLP